MDRKSDDDDVLAVAKALRSFPYSFVLVGGAAVPFLLTDPIVSARSTLDFDIVVRIATRGEYYEVEDWLRDHEFTETKDGPICRWRLDEHLIGVMHIGRRAGLFESVVRSCSPISDQTRA
jgi:hypothetical protein